MSRMLSKQRQQVALRILPSDKMPYLVRGAANTILHLTDTQAAKRSDLIPQFKSVLAESGLVRI